MSELPDGLKVNAKTGDLEWETGAHCSAYLRRLPAMVAEEVMAEYDARIASAVSRDKKLKYKRSSRLYRRRLIASLDAGLSVGTSEQVTISLSRKDAISLLVHTERASELAFDKQVADALAKEEA